MTDETNTENKTDPSPKPEGTEDTEPITEAPTVPKTASETLEAIRKEKVEFTKIRDEIKAEKEELITLKANEALAGTTGGRVEAETKEQTAKEYADKVMKGEIKE